MGSYADTTLVRLTTTSTVSQYWSQTYGGTMEGEYIGPWEPSNTWSSTYDCWNYPFFTTGLNAARVSHCPRAGAGDIAMTKTKTAVMYGDVNVAWQGKTFGGPLNCDLPGANPCFQYTGSYTFTIEPTYYYLRVTASAASVVVGDSVTFTASTSPAMSFTVRDWRWVPDNGSASSQPCGTLKVCRFAVPDSGVMYVRARLDRKLEQQKVAVGAVRRTLKLSPETKTVRRGDTVHWTAAASPAGGSLTNVAWSVSGSTTGLFTASTCTGSAATCYDVPTRSYTRIVTAVVDDSLRSDSTSVAVYTRFEVKPSLNAVVGDTVLFKAFVDDSVTRIPRWRWSGDSADADDCAGDSVCMRVIPSAAPHVMTGFLTDAVNADSARALVNSGSSCSTQNQQAGGGSFTILTSEDQDCSLDVRLECPATVVRGNEATCSVVTSPEPASLTVTKWYFVPDYADVVASLPIDTVHRYVGVDSRTWQGRMAVGGSAYATVTVDGDVRLLSSTIAVQARDSMFRLVDGVTFQYLPELSPGGLPVDVELDAHLGDNSFSAMPRPESASSITGGPNDGFMYLIDFPFVLDSRVRINTTALRNPGPLWDMQKTTMGAYDGTYWCSEDEVPGFETFVRAHEGVNRTDPQASHMRTYPPAFEAFVNQTAERIVGGDLLLTTLRDSAEAFASIESDSVTHGPDNPAVYHCKLNTNPTVILP